MWAIVYSEIMTGLVIVYRKVSERREVCSLGEAHVIPVYERREIYPSGESYVFDSGYDRARLGIFTDAVQREYRECRAFDTGRRYFVEAGNSAGASIFWDPEHYVPERHRFTDSDFGPGHEHDNCPLPPADEEEPVTPDEAAVGPYQTHERILPVTGLDNLWLAPVGAALVLLGITAFFIGRSRRND